MHEAYLVFRDADVRLTDLITSEDAELSDVLFERCLITGPAVLQPIHSQFIDNDYGIGRDHLDAALWTLSPWTDIVQGTVIAQASTQRWR